MAVLSAQTIRDQGLLAPINFEPTKDSRNCSKGMSACGYDLQLIDRITIYSLPRSIALLTLGLIGVGVSWAAPPLILVGLVLVARGLYGVYGSFRLAGAREAFNLPHDVMARVCDKSSLARRGLVVQNTIAEPGWCGYLTLELMNFGPHDLDMDYGDAIAQVVFEELDEPTVLPYNGKYQGQRQGAQKAK